jgi:hypothetical protein
MMESSWRKQSPFEHKAGYLSAVFFPFVEQVCSARLRYRFIFKWTMEATISTAVATV